MGWQAALLLACLVIVLVIAIWLWIRERVPTLREPHHTTDRVHDAGWWS